MSSSNSRKTPDKAVNASQKYKKIKFTAAAVVSAIIITIIVIAAFYIPKAIKAENEWQKAKSNIVRYTYCLAIDYRDKQGYHIPDAWLKDFRLSDFTQTTDNHFAAAIDSNGVLKAAEGAQKGDKSTITYKLDGKIACVIYAHVVEASGYITSQSDFTKLNEAEGTFIQTENIMLSASVSVKNFKGKYYGNHKVISGHDVSVGGGLFDNAKSAGFYGITLTNIKGTVAAVKDASYGALVNKAQYCKIEYCSAEGGFLVEGTDGFGSIGGIAGTLEGSKRTINEDINADYVNACTTNLNIKVKGEGSPKIGGVVGYAKNMLISNTTIRGTIEITVEDAFKIAKLYVGGFAGELVKEYETAAYRINYLDSSYNLVSEANISVTLTGGGESFNSVYAGNVFGSVVNQSVANAFCTGSLTVRCGGADAFLGGIAGRSENKMSIVNAEGSIRLFVQNCEIEKALNIESSGRVYAGGVVGYAIKTDIEDTVALIPVVTGNRGNKETKISDTVGDTAR